jgi:hypothetical protein
MFFLLFLAGEGEGQMLSSLSLFSLSLFYSVIDPSMGSHYTNRRFQLFVKAFLAVTSHFCTYRHFFVSLCPAILGFSFFALRKKALFA